jgi:hypothetical protein
MWEFWEGIVGDYTTLGLSILYVKKAFGFLFSFFSNFLEVICGICAQRRGGGGGGRGWGGFILKDWELLVEFP